MLGSYESAEAQPRSDGVQTMFSPEEQKYLDKMFKINQQNPAYGINQQQIVIDRNKRIIDLNNKDNAAMERDIALRQELIRRLSACQQ